jgi:hypothetical protein
VNTSYSETRQLGWGGARLTISTVKILSTFGSFWNLLCSGVLGVCSWSEVELGSARLSPSVGTPGDVFHNGASSDKT